MGLFFKLRLAVLLVLFAQALQPFGAYGENTNKIEIYRIPIAPVFAALDTLVRTRQGMPVGQAVRKELDERKGELALWVAYIGTTVIASQLLASDQAALISRAESSATQPILKVLNVLAPSQKGDEGFFSWDTAFLKKRFGKGVQEISVESGDDLIAQLRGLEKSGSKFDLVQFTMHGLAGHPSFKKGPSFSKRHLEELSRISLINQDGAVVFGSCNIASKLPIAGNGDVFMESVGHALLPRGGRVIASKYPIYAGSYVSKGTVASRSKDFWRGVTKGRNILEAAQLLMGNPLFVASLAQATWGGRPEAVVEKKILPEAMRPKSTRSKCLVNGLRRLTGM